LRLELWGKDLSSILEQVPDCSEKYVSQTKIAQLQLNKLGYCENALLIREEYITAINMLEGPFQPFNAVVITGQPGIGVLCSSFLSFPHYHLNMINTGKSCFLYYVLLHRLCSGKCTAFQVPGSFIVFEESGARMYDIASWNMSVIPVGSWALANSDEYSTMPCNSFLMACGKRARVIQTSPPKRSWYPHWMKECRASMYVMDHFSPAEFMALG
jgi:hypothetical protein